MSNLPASEPGGIPGLLGDFYDSNQEDLEESNDIVRNRSLYVNVATSPFKGNNQNEIAKGLEESNEAQFLPDFINIFLKKGTLFCKLTFSSKELRDSIHANNNLNFNSEPINLELPGDGGLTIYMSGIPLQASNNFVATWLQNNFGAQLAKGTSIKFMEMPGCSKIKSTSRSAVVRVPHGRIIPGYSLMRSKQGEVAKVRIWYRHSGVWCRKCFAKGHKVESCNSGGWVKAPRVTEPKTSIPPPLLDYNYETTAPNFGGVKKPLFPEATGENPPSPPKLPKPPAGVDNWAKETENDGKQKQLFNDGFPVGLLDSEYSNYFRGFYSKNDFLSNHFPSYFQINGKEYLSSEHYFQSKKAEHYNDQKAIASIEEVKHQPDKIAAIGNKIKIQPSDSTKAWRWMWDANCAKYEQNQTMLIDLFKTNNERLVYCAADSFWGCGIELASDKWKSKSNWEGQNVLGDLLTHLRRQLINDPRYSENIGLIIGNKRKATSPDIGRKQSKN